MTLEDMRKFLTNIQNQSSKTKMLNAILTCFEQIKMLEKDIIEIQYKINQIITKWNEKEGVKDAAALNHDIQEDNQQWGTMEEFRDPLTEKNDALVNQPPRSLQPENQEVK